MFLGVDGIKGTIADMRELGVWDTFQVKTQTIKTAIESACMLLRIDDIVSGLQNKWCVCCNKPEMETRLGTVHGPLLQDGKRVIDGGDHGIHHLHHVVVRRFHQLQLSRRQQRYQRREGFLAQRGRHISQEVNLRHEREVITVRYW